MTDDSATLTCQYCEQNAGDVWITASDEWERCPYCLAKEKDKARAELVRLRDAYKDEVRALRDEKAELERQVAAKTIALDEAFAVIERSRFCSDCPPIDYPTRKTRCAECPRHASRPVTVKD